MVVFDKIIKVNNGRIIKFNIYMPEENQLEPSVYSIEEYYIENDEISKSYRMCKNGGYHFSGWFNDSLQAKEQIQSLSYDFDSTHPLYIPLSHLLENDDTLVIDDEKTTELIKKYMMLCKTDDKISLFFINALKSDNVEKKFDILIKKTDYDHTSKTDSLDTDIKKRLDNFFIEVINTLVDENDHISNINNTNDEEEEKIYIKTLIPSINKN